MTFPCLLPIIVADSLSSILGIASIFRRLELLMNINVGCFEIICGVRLLVILLVIEIITVSNGFIKLCLDVLPTWNINEAQMLYVN